METDFVIGHNVQFDIKFLKHEIQQLWGAGMIEEKWEPKILLYNGLLQKYMPKIP